MKTHSKKIALFLNAFVIPGMGQAYLGRKVSGILWMTLSVLLLGGTMIRFMSVTFELMAATHSSHKTMGFNPFPYLKAAWVVDHRVLLLLILGTFLVWLLAILDLIWKK